MITAPPSAPGASAPYPRSARARGIRWLRRFCLVAGALLLAFVGVARLHSVLASRSGLEHFEQVRSARLAAAPRVALSATGEPDQRLWAEKRIAAYQASLQQNLGLPAAVLRIPRLALAVPIWEGTDELTLNRGLGHVAGTVRPGERGNVGIAGHRDGFFRVLKDIAVGDEIELETLAGIERFAVEQTMVVRPEDVWVLEPTPQPALTLVTCYPFYYSGKAPERFIVRAAVRRVEGERLAVAR